MRYKCGTYTHFNILSFFSFFFFFFFLLTFFYWQSKISLVFTFWLLLKKRRVATNMLSISKKYLSIDLLWFFSKVRPNGIGTVVTEMHTLSIPFSKNGFYSFFFFFLSFFLSQYRLHTFSQYFSFHRKTYYYVRSIEVTIALETRRAAFFF